MLGRAIVVIVAVALACSTSAQCRDPWITETVNAYTKRVKGRLAIGRGDRGECNFRLYGSTWSSKQQLSGRIRASFDAINGAGLEFGGETTLVDRTYRAEIQTASPHFYAGPRSGAPGADQTRTGEGLYWWHIALPNDHVLAVARKCRRGFVLADDGSCSH